MTKLNRRSFITSISLGSIGTIIAGCTDPEQLDEDRSSTPENETGYSIQITSPYQNIEYSGEVTQPLYSEPSEPVTLEISITNTSSEPVTIGDQRDAFFSYQTTNSYGLYDLSNFSDSSYEYNSQDERWELLQPPVRTSDFQTETVEPNEEITRQISLVYLPFESQSPENEPPLQLQFENQVQFEKSGESDWVSNILTLSYNPDESM